MRLPTVFSLWRCSRDGSVGRPVHHFGLISQQLWDGLPWYSFMGMKATVFSSKLTFFFIEISQPLKPDEHGSIIIVSMSASWCEHVAQCSPTLAWLSTLYYSLCWSNRCSCWWIKLWCLISEHFFVTVISVPTKLPHHLRMNPV